MSVRTLILSFAALASLAVAPATRAGDFDKYVPAKSEFYVHITPPKFFTSQLVRKAVPMAFERYGDQMVEGMALLKGLPGAPDLPEDQLKAAIKDLGDEQKIAQGFDIAKKFVTDIVIAGSAQAGMPDAIVLIKSEAISKEGADMIAQMSGAFPQAGKIDVVKKSMGTIYVMTPPQGDQKVYFTVPEKGILHIASSEELAEQSFGAAGKPSEKLAAQIAKRNANDFLFVAGVGNEQADFTAMAVNLILDKDLTSKFDVEYKDAAKASDQAKEANQHLGEMVEKIREALGAKGEALKTQIAKTKAEANGTKVSASLSIPGKIVEELLKPEKEKEKEKPKEME
ncbi:MAG: hypothetical protein ACJ8C4_13825 [Gemmataceae bacterium]